MSFSYKITHAHFTNFETVFSQINHLGFNDHYIEIAADGTLSLTQDKVAAASIIQICELQACLQNYASQNLDPSWQATVENTQNSLSNIAAHHLRLSITDNTAPPSEDLDGLLPASETAVDFDDSLEEDVIIYVEENLLPVHDISRLKFYQQFITIHKWVSPTNEDYEDDPYLPETSKIQSSTSTDISRSELEIIGKKILETVGLPVSEDKSTMLNYEKTLLSNNFVTGDNHEKLSKYEKRALAVANHIKELKKLIKNYLRYIKLMDWTIDHFLEQLTLVELQIMTLKPEILTNPDLFTFIRKASIRQLELIAAKPALLDVPEMLQKLLQLNPEELDILESLIIRQLAVAKPAPKIKESIYRKFINSRLMRITPPTRSSSLHYKRTKRISSLSYYKIEAEIQQFLATGHYDRLPSIPINFHSVVNFCDRRYETSTGKPFEWELDLNPSGNNSYHKTKLRSYVGHEWQSLKFTLGKSLIPKVESAEHAGYQIILESLQKKLLEIIINPLAEHYIDPEIVQAFKAENYHNVKNAIVNAVYYISSLFVDCLEYNFAYYKDPSNGLSKTDEKLNNFKSDLIKLFDHALTPVRAHESSLVENTSIGRQNYPPIFAQKSKVLFLSLLNEFDEMIQAELCQK